MEHSSSSLDQYLELREGISALREVQVGYLPPYNPHGDGVQFESDALLYPAGYVCDGMKILSDVALIHVHVPCNRIAPAFVMIVQSGEYILF